MQNRALLRIFEGIVQPEQVLPTAHRVRAEKKEEVFPWLPLQTKKYFLVRENITSLCQQIVKLHNLQTYRASLLFLPDWYQNLRYLQYPRPDLLW